jgi:2,5-diamino-6-(ribosylamino)-4(3H)-pyrimidinone 5'-phosphate reductase
MRPRVILHNAVSLNGMLTGFDVDMGLYYRLAGVLDCQASLVGSGTILAASESAEEDPQDERWHPAARSSTRPQTLVVADSRGLVKCWGFLQRSGFWTRFVSLASETTPPEHLAYLARRDVGVVQTGDERCDLSKALGVLGEHYGIARLRTDSGGTLNQALLTAGLIDEISLVVVPVVADARSEVPLFRGGTPGALSVVLTHEERFEGGEVWLRYEVT